MSESFSNNGTGNIIDIPDSGLSMSGHVKGNNNRIKIEPTMRLQLQLRITGNNNTVHIGRNFTARRLEVDIGNHVPANGASLRIGNNCSAEGNCRFLIYNSGNSLKIGEECMLSNSIIIRTSESPHLIFDNETGEYLDTSGNVMIGNHCWIGERAYLTKRTSLPNDTIVAACSVVTRAFSEQMTVLAGNPAEVKRRNIRWIRNANRIAPGSIFQSSYNSFLARHETGHDSPESLKIRSE